MARLVILLFAVIGLYACASTVPAITGAEPPRADRPTYVIGDRWIRNDGVFELARIEADRYVFIATGNREIRLTRTLALARMQSGRLFVEMDPPAQLTWPLRVGASGVTPTTWRWEGNPAGVPVNLSWKVEAYEDAVTDGPLRSVKAFRIALTAERERGSWRRTLRLWYSPDAERFVKGQGTEGQVTVRTLETFVATAFDAPKRPMSVEEARQVTASFAGSAFVPPPRTIEDITAILDEKRLQNLDEVMRRRAAAAEATLSEDAEDLAGQVDSHYRRGEARRRAGQAKGAIEDYQKALELLDAGSGGRVPRHRVVAGLAEAENLGGSWTRAIRRFREAIDATPPEEAALRFNLSFSFAWLVARRGDFAEAESAVRAMETLHQNALRARADPVQSARRLALIARARGGVFLARGDYGRAEAAFREALAQVAPHPQLVRSWDSDLLNASLGEALTSQGRLLEGEKQCRVAMLGTVNRAGRYSFETGVVLSYFTQQLAVQGRVAESGELARAAVDIYTTLGVPPDSLRLATARAHVGRALHAQGRWREALAEYAAAEAGLANDRETLDKQFRSRLDWGLARLNAGEVDAAIAQLRLAVETRGRQLGPAHRQTALARGALAMAYRANGQAREALSEFSGAAPLLTGRAWRVADSEGAATALGGGLRGQILRVYIGLLAEIRGTPLEREARLDAAAEAFRLADEARGQTVQHALDAAAARAAAATPALAELIREEQDARKRIGGLEGTLVNALSAPAGETNMDSVNALRAQIEMLRRAADEIGRQIAARFPSHAELVDPALATVEQVRRSLRPGEALLSLYVTGDRTFVWAIGPAGQVAFHAAVVSARTLDQRVSTLRSALAPSATRIGDIPAFDVTAAHELYRRLLEPVRSAWEGADSLLVAANGPLGHLPFALLPTKLARLDDERGGLFSKYRGVPWLVRTHAVTVLPSVTALVTLRSLPAGAAGRRPFAGFGDPYFSLAQARNAADDAGRSREAARESEGSAIALRNLHLAPSSGRLSVLPRLPDTADEIRGIAAVMGADATRDVFLGERANVRAVKALDLAGYRVIAFATHGLVPGDLDGLTQPALALSAPEVAGIDGDGLLTMEEVLGLRLDADWVVLSACNTASGDGTRAEAISGLGRAFFYAGARALLVSNWPIETTSARLLTTDIFRRQQLDHRLTRARALQQAMVAMIDDGVALDPRTRAVVFSYAHPIFWAPFTLVGDGG